MRLAVIVLALEIFLGGCATVHRHASAPPPPRLAVPISPPGTAGPVAAGTPVVSRTYSPVADQPSYTVWNVIACGSQDVPAGEMYRDLASHGVGFLLNSEANALIAAVDAKSPWSVAYQWSTYGLAGLSALLNLDVIKAKPSYVRAGNVADGVLNVLIPIAQQKKPIAFPGWYPLLVRDHDVLRVGASDCQAAVVLGGRGSGFTITSPSL